MNVGQNTTLGDGDVTQQLVQLLVVANGELQVAGDDTGLLVVTGSVASQLKNLSSKILKDGSQVDGGTSTDTLGVVALTEQTVDTTDRECQTGLGRTAVNGTCQLLMVITGVLDDDQDEKTRQTRRKSGEVLTTARSWSRWPCRRTCHQSF